jgi:dipeptidase D
MSNIPQIHPQSVWKNFAALNDVPRASKKEERVIAFVKNFGESLGLETIVDTVGNVIIKKPATAGMENRQTIVLQSHLDMVHQKNADTVFDFDTQGIDMYVDGDWVRARGTTLGADNGMGVAAIMAVLERNDIQHPAIEALFTIDEETGMTGAMGLRGGLLEGTILLNLDTEEDDEIDIGCAGGIDVTAEGAYNEIEMLEGAVAYNILVKGLNGGHSGMDIDKGLGNANKIMNRILFACRGAKINVTEINGGSLRNAIPRESFAKVVMAPANRQAFLDIVQKEIADIKAECKTAEPNLAVSVESSDTPQKVMEPAAQKKLISTLYAAHNGVYRMSADMDNLVETSNNIARVIVKEGKIHIGCLTRSSVESSKLDLANALQNTFELAGYTVNFSGSYPGWTPNVNSAILKVLKELYVNLNGREPHVVACHAGLECGILGTNYPQMDMISFGPTIKGAHSPDERVSIPSVEKFWKYLVEILRNIPLK